jgi:hypothetical protein
MSTGIFQSIQKMAEINIGFESRAGNELTSEQPTVADLVLPGSGYSFADEFACLLNVLSEATTR